MNCPRETYHLYQAVTGSVAASLTQVRRQMPCSYVLAGGGYCPDKDESLLCGHYLDAFVVFGDQYESAAEMKKDCSLCHQDCRWKSSLLHFSCCPQSKDAFAWR